MVLEDEREEDTVRHEAVATDMVLPVLRKWVAENVTLKVVRESCVVTIDVWEVCCSSDF